MRLKGRSVGARKEKLEVVDDIIMNYLRKGY